ncbi:hypothetical protein CPLU01_10887 [Colletotrichum plurivorum]|uniref:Ankyrin repeat protein n=1 Tax=Colletotrichum plurivorum TaxID=2175906 RepID=A0A8H6K422_9PEZI|nr:hypothetical protein CPLU01_10887 [Colletotrichum plurivorum]
MAEILGTVVGVVSLGLQVCSGLTTYLDGIQCQKDDVAATTRHSQSMQTFRNQLGYKDRVTTVTGTQDAFASLAQAVSTADTELRLLRDFIDKLCGKCVASRSSSTVDKVQKKLRYPFRWDHLELSMEGLPRRTRRFKPPFSDTLRRIEADGSTFRAEIRGKLDDIHQVSMQGRDTMHDISNADKPRIGTSDLRPPRALAHMEASHAAILDVQRRLDHARTITPPRSSVPEALEVLENMESSDIRVVLHRLLSKPDVLRIACEYAESRAEVAAPNQSEKLCTVGNDSSAFAIGSYARLLKCHCNPRQRLRQRTRNFGPVFFTKGAVTPRAHASGCPHAAWNGEQDFWWLGLALSKAVTVTLVSSTGAGGYGMSPEHVKYRPIHPNSPAFRMIDSCQDVPRPREDAVEYLPIVRLLWPDDDVLEEAMATDCPLDFGLVPGSIGNHFLLNESLIPNSDRWLGSCLHVAIGEKNMKALAAILDQSTVLDWSEPDILGFTPLQHLSFWIDGLRLVLTCLGDSILQIHDRHPISLLQCSFSWSSKTCQETIPEIRCSASCSCNQVASLLLEKQCRIDLDEPFLADLMRATVRCQKTFVFHLKSRRDRLRDLALMHLSSEEIERSGVSRSSVLDVQTSAVIHALTRRCVEVGSELATCTNVAHSVFMCDLRRNFGVAEAEAGATVSCSIYHCLALFCPNLISLNSMTPRFHQQGFEDVDSKNSFDLTPLMIAQSYHNVPLVIWLLEHGADPLVQVPNHVSGYAVAHSMYTSFLDSFEEGDLSGAFFIIQDKSPLDSCCCSCSPDGCRPLSMLWKRSDYGLARQHPHSCEWCVSWYEGKYGFTPEVELMILRIATFEALRLRHTCCDEGFVDIEEEDREEIWDKDSAMIIKLEELLIEHQEALSRSSCSLPVFLRTQWKDRIVQVLDELQKQSTLAREEREAMAGLGISLEYERSESEDEQEQFARETGPDLDELRLAYKGTTLAKLSHRRW